MRHCYAMRLSIDFRNKQTGTCRKKAKNIIQSYVMRMIDLSLLQFIARFVHFLKSCALIYN